MIPALLLSVCLIGQHGHCRFHEFRFDTMAECREAESRAHAAWKAPWRVTMALCIQEDDRLP